MARPIISTITTHSEKPHAVMRINASLRLSSSRKNTNMTEGFFRESNTSAHSDSRIKRLYSFTIGNEATGFLRAQPRGRRTSKKGKFTPRSESPPLCLWFIHHLARIFLMLLAIQQAHVLAFYKALRGTQVTLDGSDLFTC